MDRRNWTYMRLAGSTLLALVAIHGATNKEWRQLHTLGVVLSAVAVLGVELS